MKPKRDSLPSSSEEAGEKGASALPASVRKLFWDTDARSLRWDRHRDALIGRILAAGTWADVTWLRKKVGAPALREWILRHEGRGLTPQQLRFWQLLLALPRHEVDRWLRSEARQVWDRRTTP
jgi:hypothetical protein